MLKNSLIFFLCVFLLSNCGEQHSTVTVSETKAAPVTSQPDTIKMPRQTVELTAFELRDDSVFTDGSIPTSWANAGFTNVKGFKLFLKKVQLWIMDNNKDSLSQIIRYPLRGLKNPSELVAAYDSVFTKPVKLSFATLNFSQVFRNQNGAMTDAGKVWFTKSGDGYKIIAINP